MPLSLGLDLILGEPPRILHPVVWMGRFISFLEGRAPGKGIFSILYGAILSLIVIAIFSIPPYLLLRWLHGISPPLHLILSAILLKISFSWRELERTARKVGRLLEDGKLEEARREVRSLVGRRTENLPPHLVASAAIESTAENTCDSFIAPTFYFLLLGVPGALAYRAANTLDAMLGYREGKYEWLGKFPARLDDLLNLIPARLTALLLLTSALIHGRNPKGALRSLLRHRSLTPSPNAGWTISTIAGALNLSLEKRGVYRIGEGKEPEPGDIKKALLICRTSALLWTALILGAIGIKGGFILGAQT